MIELETLVLADKTVISKGEASNMVAPMGSSLTRPVGMKAAKKHVDNNLKKYVWMKESEESMHKMASSQIKMAAIMVCKQTFIKKQSKKLIFGNFRNNMNQGMIHQNWLT